MQLVGVWQARRIGNQFEFLVNHTVSHLLEIKFHLKHLLRVTVPFTFTVERAFFAYKERAIICFSHSFLTPSLKVFDLTFSQVVPLIRRRCECSGEDEIRKTLSPEDLSPLPVSLKS